MRDLRIPLAYDALGNFISCKTAPRGANYFCPNCMVRVVLKRGDVRVAHFSHKSNGKCSGEGVLHKTAKIMVMTAIIDGLRGIGEMPVVLRECRRCGTHIRGSISKDTASALIEQWTSNGLRVDVGLYDRTSVMIEAFEIYVKHAVDRVKYGEMPIPFVEVNGRDVVDNPLILIATQYKPPLTCASCVREMERIAEANRLRKEREAEEERHRREEERKKRDMEELAELERRDIARQLQEEARIEENQSWWRNMLEHEYEDPDEKRRKREEARVKKEEEARERERLEAERKRKDLELARIAEERRIAELKREELRVAKDAAGRDVWTLFYSDIKRVSEEFGVEILDSAVSDRYYRHGIARCSSCGRDVIVYAWPRKSLLDQSEPRMIPPISVKKIRSAHGEWWANMCLNCDEPIPNVDIHGTQRGPFHGLNINTDSDLAFVSDMAMIAKHHYRNNGYTMQQAIERERPCRPITHHFPTRRRPYRNGRYSF